AQPMSSSHWAPRELTMTAIERLRGARGARSGGGSLLSIVSSIASKSASLVPSARTIDGAVEPSDRLAQTIAPDRHLGIFPVETDVLRADVANQSNRRSLEEATHHLHAVGGRVRTPAHTTRGEPPDELRDTYAVARRLRLVDV